MPDSISALIVDDEGHLRVMLRTLLKRIGVTEFHEASNGEEACVLYGEKRPDLVLMDVNMNGINGIETLQEIRRIDADARVVMLTSLTSRKIVEASIDSGATHFLRKDTPIKEMEKILAGILEDTESDTQ